MLMCISGSTQGKLAAAQEYADHERQRCRNYQ
jgi:hypothetical protein